LSSRPSHIRRPTEAVYLRDLFSDSARYYEWVNRLTSLGQVDLWRREVVRSARVGVADRVLDAFSGPGGLAEQALRHLGPQGELVLADLSPVMLDQARVRLQRRLDLRVRSGPPVSYLTGDLLRDELGLTDFDVVLVGWGLRYVEDVRGALSRLGSFLRPGGRLVVLEFTRPQPISWAAPAHFYFREVLPRIGSWLAGDPELHDYLRVSSAGFFDARGLSRTVEEVGLRCESCRSRLGGLVTVLTALSPSAPAGTEVREWRT
jgi:demethylmenaquinone methyltransferase/2-methoxy-6-polyprenyl-1,4-benzoquinol methylase